LRVTVPLLFDLSHAIVLEAELASPGKMAQPKRPIPKTHNIAPPTDNNNITASSLKLSGVKKNMPMGSPSEYHNIP